MAKPKKPKKVEEPNLSALEERKTIMGPSSASFIERARQFRMLYGLSRKEMAEKFLEVYESDPVKYVKISEGSWQKLEDGFTRNVTLDQAVTVCATLENNIGVMLGFSDEGENVPDIVTYSHNLLTKMTAVQKTFDLAVRISKLPDGLQSAVNLLMRETERAVTLAEVDQAQLDKVS